MKSNPAKRKMLKEIASIVVVGGPEPDMLARVTQVLLILGIVDTAVTTRDYTGASISFTRGGVLNKDNKHISYQIVFPL